MHADTKFYGSFLRFFFFLQLSVRHERTEQTPLCRTCVLYFSSRRIRPNLYSLYLRTPADVPRFRASLGPRRTCSIPYRARAVDNPPVNIHDVWSAFGRSRIQMKSTTVLFGSVAVCGINKLCGKHDVFYTF